MKQIKLKQITERIAVATPTKKEAKELLAILHENGYKWYSGDSLIKQNYWGYFKGFTVYFIDLDKTVCYGSQETRFTEFSHGHITLAEFKARYVVEEEHPHNEALNLQGFPEGTLLHFRKTNDLKALLIMLRDNGYKPCKEFTTSLDGFVLAIEIMPDKKFHFVPLFKDEQIKGGINRSVYVELLDMFATFGKNIKNTITALGGFIKPETKMKKYIGTKVVTATPAIRKGGKVYLPTEEIPKSMETVEEGYKVIYEDGYESWSPKDVFEKAYQSIEGGMSFGHAIEFLKSGYALKRKGWNGKGLMVIKQVPAHIDGTIIPNMQSLPQSAKEQVMKHTGFIAYTSQCLIYNSQTGRADSWAPSISDVFADDWELVAE